ncbi:MAG: sortase [Dehalococcoidia bacterium]|nr:sortase [Dehalococcoidia bacterium]
MDRFIGLWALIFVRPLFVLGILVAAIGVLMVLFSVGYFARGAYSEANLDELKVTQAESGITQEDLTRGLPTALPTTALTSAPSATPAALVNSPSPGTTPLAVTTDTQQPTSTTEDSTQGDETGDSNLYDEYGILRDFSHYLAEADDGALLEPIKENFRAVTEDDLVDTYGEEPRPLHIIIPAIELESNIIDLNILWDGETSEWETADRVVGFHVGSATPGEIGNTVMSGHVNSPFAGEGSIFARLDEIAPLLRRGEIVDIMVMAGGDVFLYRATDTTVVLPEDVDVFDYSDSPTLSLVTCAPATTYSHRFIVNATLVGVARL